MLAMQSKQSTFKKSFKWSLFLILMAASVFAYTNTAKKNQGELIQPKKTGPVKKYTQNDKNNLPNHVVFDLVKDITPQNNNFKHIGDRSFFNLNDQEDHGHKKEVSFLSKQDTENPEQTFQYPEEGGQAGNNTPNQPQLLARFNPDNNPIRSQYIQGQGAGGGSTGAGAGGGGNGGSKEGEGNPDNTIGGEGNGTAVSAVPVPPAIWLLGSALLGFVGLRRR